jgi:hypothetical protein
MMILRRVNVESNMQQKRAIFATVTGTISTWVSEP